MRVSSRRIISSLKTAPAAVLLAASPAFANESLPSLTTAALRSLAALGGVLALILALAWLLRRFKDSTKVTTEGVALRSVARLDLGAKRELRLVQAEDRMVLLGLTDQRCELLTEWDATEDDAAQPAIDPPVALEVLQKLATSS